MSASSVKWVRLGDYIEPCDERNSDGLYNLDDVRGISIMKKLISTKADMKDVILTPYKLLKPSEFSYVTVTSRNGGKISLALNDTENTFIVSSSYINFRPKNNSELLSEYLYLLLSREEFDRYSRFNSWGSARETFDWEELCRVIIPLPDPKVQQELVDTYSGLKALAEQNEALIEPLSKACEAFIVDCKNKYTEVELGEYIEECSEKNRDYHYKADDARGVYCDGTFGDTKANLEGSDLAAYKVVNTNEFAYSNRINIGSIAINYGPSVIISPSYTVFKIKSDKIIHQYLFLIFRRKEFLRSTLFYAIGTIKDEFSYERMEEVRIPLPPIDMQQSIVNLYNCLEEAKKIAKEAREKLKTLCPALVQRAANS